MINQKQLKVVLLCVAMICPLICLPAVRLPQLISDGMVLQRGSSIKLWGWANPREAITIKFDRKVWKTMADSSGDWYVKIPPMKPGGPFTMLINGSNHLEVKDILVGDVWFCSGQSNMVLPMERVKERYPDEIISADYPQVRNFFIPTAADVQQVHSDLPPGKWIKSSPANVLGFGAATYFFAKKLYEKYRVPIGIINSSVGGTPIQAWIGEEGIKNIGDYGRRLRQFKDTSFMRKALQPDKSAAMPAKGVTEADRGLSADVKWYDVAYQPLNWHKFWLPGYWADQGVRGLNGIVWFRKEIIVPPELAGKPAKLFLGRIVDADETYINGQKVGNITYQYPPRRYSVPAGLLKMGKNIIIVRITNTAGKGGFVPDKRYELTDGKTSLDLRGDWTYQVGLAFGAEPVAGKSNNFNFSAQNEPTGLYNTMVAPVINYAIKGMVWYQGESNTGTANYRELLVALIDNWRKAWQQPQLPFLIVQLPNYGEVQYTPGSSQWAEIREAQLQALSLPRTGMAVTIDAGEWNDIHPLDKKDVGERLALAAEKVAYNETALSAPGPLYRTAEINGDRIFVRFNNVGGGLIAKGGVPLAQFAIAGSDKRFVWADARIKGDQVIVSSPEVVQPLYVRYAWSDNPEGANLYNKEGLPASPFRTDKP